MNFNTNYRKLWLALLAISFCGCALIAIADQSHQEYIITYGDHLIITIFGYEKEATEPIVVRPDGMITYSVIGEIKAAGLTIPQLSEEIRKKLVESGQYANPLVTVQLKESVQASIYVIGEVIEPGQKKIIKPISVVEALAFAGGFKETADLANATIIRQGKDVAFIDLEFLKSDPITQKSLINKIPDENFILKNGDVLSIPSRIKDRMVNIIGHVHKPGMYPVRSNVGIIEALALAGGALEDTADLKHVIIISDSVKTVDVTEIWRNSSNLDLIKPGDSVIVSEKGKISILGIVDKQGQYVVTDKITIIEALSLSGVKDGADLKKIKIIRITGEEITVDISKLWKQPSSYIQETINPGDIVIVPAKRFAINWNAVYSAVMVFSTLYAVFK